MRHLRILLVILVTLVINAAAAISFSRAAPGIHSPGIQSSDGWLMTGPFGGDVRSLQADPRSSSHLLLGAAGGQIFETIDGAMTWRRLLPGIEDETLTVDALIFDPDRPGVVYAALQGGDDIHGGVYKSLDGGRNWTSLSGIANHSVRALAMWKGNSQVLVAGAIDGVFQTENGGETWKRISPEGHAEIKNVDSIAIDPSDPRTIYTGTFHLPWKTTDGGNTWFSIKNGIIDDSDIFTIEIDQSNPAHVFASACSGIYETPSAGQQWKKVLGIPATSRRTYAITLAPGNPQIIFAGTSEGLWRSMDGGERWSRLTSKSLVVNAVLVLPQAGNRVVIGADDAGVLVSDDLGASFSERNIGFVHRQITALLPDIENPERVYAGGAFDGEYGGLFVSDDAGITWRRSSAGLSPRDVLALFQDAGRPSLLYAGTNDGLYRSLNRGATWSRVVRSKVRLVQKPEKPGAGAQTVRTSAVLSPQSRRIRPRTPRPKAPRAVSFDLARNVFQIALHPSSHELFAATWDGLFRTADPQQGWRKMPISGYSGRVSAVAWINDTVLLAGTPQGLFTTSDFGATWKKPQGGLSQEPVLSLVDDAIHHTLYAGTNHSLYRSRDDGTSWLRLAALPYGQYFTILTDPKNPSVIVASDASPNGAVYRSADGGNSWSRFTGAPSSRWASARFALSREGRFFAGSRGSGVLVFEGIPDFSLR